MAEFLEVAKRAALEAGALLKEKVGKVGAYEKHPADLVTEADVAAQRRIEEIVLGAFPDHSFLGEESQGSTPYFGEALRSRVSCSRFRTSKPRTPRRNTFPAACESRNRTKTRRHR